MHRLENIRVVDGDTFEADIVLEEEYPLLKVKVSTSLRRKIRLCGVDTPETYGTYLEEEEDLGKAIKEYLILLFASAEEVRLEPRHPGVDSFGRVIGEVWVTDKGGSYPLGEWLFDSGLAKLYEVDPEPWWREGELIRGIETVHNFIELLSKDEQ